MIQNDVNCLKTSFLTDEEKTIKVSCKKDKLRKNFFASPSSSNINSIFACETCSYYQRDDWYRHWHFDVVLVLSDKSAIKNVKSNLWAWKVADRVTEIYWTFSSGFEYRMKILGWNILKLKPSSFYFLL